MTEIEQLREDVAKLRERVAVLEAVRHPVASIFPMQPFAPVTDPWRHTGSPPWINPYEVTCVSVPSGGGITHN